MIKLEIYLVNEIDTKNYKKTRDCISSSNEDYLKWEMMILEEGRRMLVWQKTLPPPTRR